MKILDKRIIVMFDNIQKNQLFNEKNAGMIKINVNASSKKIVNISSNNLTNDFIEGDLLQMAYVIGDLVKHG